MLTPAASNEVSPAPTVTPCASACKPARPRRLTVGSLPAPWPAYAPRPDPLPYLRLRGRWLQDAGFAVGAKIRVRVESQRLILELEGDERPESPAAPLRVQELRESRDTISRRTCAPRAR